MRWSQGLIPTLKEIPADTEAISHVLMIRAGLIRKLISGVYTYLPLGFLALKKVEAIIREELNAIGAQEVLMPAIQPKALWQESGRAEALGEDMIRVIDRHKTELVFGPTHEEVITDLIRKEVSSYKELPLSIYQIQTKFRDEARPRFGVIRSKEFIMKDAYSFHRDVQSLNEVYEKFYGAYNRIFERCGLKVTIVEADTGFMGGDVSHEFLVIAESGEDKVVTCSGCNYISGFDKAECAYSLEPRTKNPEPLKEVDTPGVSTIEAVSKFLKIRPEQLVKTLIYKVDDRFVAVLIRGDDDLNESKLRKALKARHIELADAQSVARITNAPVGFAGPVGLKGVDIIADCSIKDMANFASGANKKDKHIININSDRDFNAAGFYDLRYIRDDEPCPKCKKPVKIKSAIEVGHVFKLGTKYSKALNAKFLDSDGQSKEFIMGCYGIGVNRIVACAIEQNHDKDGIIWPISIAPYKVLISALNVQDKNVVEISQKLYNELLKVEKSVLFDDRELSAGIKLKDADLIGIPIRVIVGPKTLAENKVEVSLRRNKESKKVDIDNVIDEVKNLLR